MLCKLAMKWNLMRMCTSWLCPFKSNRQTLWTKFFFPKLAPNTRHHPRVCLLLFSRQLTSLSVRPSRAVDTWLLCQPHLARQVSPNPTILGLQCTCNCRRIDQGRSKVSFLFSRPTRQMKTPYWNTLRRRITSIHSAPTCIQLTSLTSPVNGSLQLDQKDEWGTLQGCNSITNLISSRLLKYEKKGKDRFKCGVASQWKVKTTSGWAGPCLSFYAAGD